jgi:hypothetical protein
MSPYQQKWLEVLSNAGLPGWKIAVVEDNVLIEMPHVTDLKLIRDNLPEVLGAIALDIDLPRERLKFIIRNGYEDFEYVMNPHQADLDQP